MIYTFYLSIRCPTHDDTPRHLCTLKVINTINTIKITTRRLVNIYNNTKTHDRPDARDTRVGNSYRCENGKYLRILFTIDVFISYVSLLILYYTYK